MNKITKIFAIMAVSLSMMLSHAAIGADNYTPKNPVEKVNRSLSLVEKKVRNAAVKVVTSGGHGSVQ